jgi:hypothetical protein
MASTPYQCHTSAACGTETDIEFKGYLVIDDGGASFVETSATPSAARQGEESGRAHLTIRDRLPFDEENWGSFLDRPKIEVLELHKIRWSSEEMCRALAAVKFLDLHLQRSN